MFKSMLHVAFAVAVPMILGCQPTPDESGSQDVPVSADPHDDHGHDHDHAHPSHGPHDGELIELGSDEYHAELIHDDKSVTIYLLDGAAKAAVPIDAQELVINLSHDGKPQQFKLTASRDAADPEGKSSKFVSSDAELATHLDDEKSAAKLVVEINGKSYRGDLAHDHEHDHAH